MSKKLTVTELKQQLHPKTQAELIGEILLLYKKFPVVQEYYQSSLSEDDTDILNKYKDIVNGEFLWKGNRLPKMRLSVARKAVNDFKKVARSNHSVAELMLTYVEAGVSCTLEFGDIDAPFYYSMESMYDAVLKFVVKEKLFQEFKDRLKMVVVNTRDMGWGFHDQLSDLYEQYETMISKP